MSVPRERVDPRVAALRALWLTIGWNCFGGIGALVAGLASGNVALGGLGANTILDTGASALLVWHFRHPPGEAGTRSEDRVLRWILAAMVGVALVVAIQATRAIAGHRHPSASAAGVVVLIGSIVILPPVAIRKIRLARRLRSEVLRGDGFLTSVSAGLALATLGGIALDHAVDWWWATHVAALLIACVLLAEAWTLGRRGSLDQPSATR